MVNCQAKQVVEARDYLASYLPIGWQAKAVDSKQFVHEVKEEVAKRGWPAWVLGILISIFAVSLGGEFWFKTMQEVIRLAGPKGGAAKPAASAG